MDPGTASHEVTDIARKMTEVYGTASFTAADLRRTAETMLASLGVGKETRAQLLSHGRTSGVQALHYDRYHYLTEKRRALELWETHLREIFTGSRGGKVVGIGKVN